MAELARDVGTLESMRALARSADFKAKATDDRFAALLAANATNAVAATPRAVQVAKTQDGRDIATMTHAAGHYRIQLHREHNEAFASFVMSKLPELLGLYEGGRSDD